ncbi:hypothetical protein EON66_00410 [archaeon]|nr:MAG: hypothetical protein EON66_00410 [archaeon]
MQVFLENAKNGPARAAAKAMHDIAGWKREGSLRSPVGCAQNACLAPAVASLSPYPLHNHV